MGCAKQGDTTLYLAWSLVNRSVLRCAGTEGRYLESSRMRRTVWVKISEKENSPLQLYDIYS